MVGNFSYRNGRERKTEHKSAEQVKRFYHNVNCTNNSINRFANPHTKQPSSTRRERHHMAGHNLLTTQLDVKPKQPVSAIFLYQWHSYGVGQLSTLKNSRSCVMVSNSKSRCCKANFLTWHTFVQIRIFPEKNIWLLYLHINIVLRVKSVSGNQVTSSLMARFLNVQ